MPPATPTIRRVPTMFQRSPISAHGNRDLSSTVRGNKPSYRSRRTATCASLILEPAIFPDERGMQPATPTSRRVPTMSTDSFMLQLPPADRPSVSRAMRVRTPAHPTIQIMAVRVFLYQPSQRFASSESRLGPAAPTRPAWHPG